MDFYKDTLEERTEEALENGKQIRLYQASTQSNEEEDEEECESEISQDLIEDEDLQTYDLDYIFSELKRFPFLSPFVIVRQLFYQCFGNLEELSQHLDEEENLFYLANLIIEYPFCIAPSIFFEVAFLMATFFGDTFYLQLFFLLIPLDKTVMETIKICLEKLEDSSFSPQYCKTIYYLMTETNLPLNILDENIQNIFNYCGTGEAEVLNKYAFKVRIKSFEKFSSLFNLDLYLQNGEFTEQTYSLLTRIFSAKLYSFENVEHLHYLTILANPLDYKSKEQATILISTYLLNTPIAELEENLLEYQDSFEELLISIQEIDTISKKQLYKHFESSEELIEMVPEEERHCEEEEEES